VRKLALIGAGGHGRVVRETALISGWDEIDFFDDHLEIDPSKNIVGSVDYFLANMQQYDGVVVAIGNNKIRAALYLMLENAGANFATIIHPFSFISDSAFIGLGSVVMAGVIVNSKVIIGRGSILNTSCSIDHDCEIGDFVHLCPGVHLAGGVCINSESWIGISSSIIQNIKIDKSVFVAAGSLVISDVSSGNSVRGVPAKPYKQNKNEH
jgi:sugar O-acyltransferase (sialic acid O-acetyltransferase NeuD family)